MNNETKKKETGFTEELIKKNISVNSTIQNWIRRRQENNPNYGVKKESKSLTIEEQILKNYKA